MRFNKHATKWMFLKGRPLSKLGLCKSEAQTFKIRNIFSIFKIPDVYGKLTRFTFYYCIQNI